MSVTDAIRRKERNLTGEMQEIAEYGYYINAIMARNMGDLEGQMAVAQQDFAEVGAALAAAGVQILNEPNLLKQNFWTQKTWDTEDAPKVPYGNVARIAGTNCPYLKSIKLNATDTGETQTITDPETGEESAIPIYSYSDGDEITVEVVELDENNRVAEADGEVFDHALAFTVANAPESGYNNSEDLIYLYPFSSDGKYGKIDAMEDGKTYTMSCWVRVTDGTKARLAFKWGYPANGIESWGTATYIDTSGAAWHRVDWSFVYHSEITIPNGDEPFTITPAKRVSFGVCRKYNGTVQLCGFRLTEGGLYKGTNIDMLMAEMAALRERVDALVTANELIEPEDDAPEVSEPAEQTEGGDGE